MSSYSKIFLLGHGYGYCKFRALSLADRGLRNNSLCAGYEINLVELFKEYEDEFSQMDFDFGYQTGRFFAEMTNLAETGKCMTNKWLDAQKQRYVVIDMHKKWLEKKYGPLSQLAEETNSKFVQSRFKSEEGHQD